MNAQQIKIEQVLRSINLNLDGVTVHRDDVFVRRDQGDTALVAEKIVKLLGWNQEATEYGAIILRRPR